MSDRRRRRPPRDLLDTVNGAVWADSGVVAEFARGSDWLDEGERRSVEAANELRPQARVLDVGVGAGRTVELLRRFGPGYRGFDYSPTMVAACRRRYPDSDVVEGDARHMTWIDDASCDVVMFSNNGIDAVSHEDRAQILAEIHRVLVPGGLFLFSTYNLDGPSARERPWTLPGLDLSTPYRTLGRVKYRVLTFPRGLRNYLRLRGDYPRGDGWQVRINGSHEFGIVIHHITLAAQESELATAGFVDTRVWSGNDGTEVTPADRTRGVWYFHLLTRKAD